MTTSSCTIRNCLAGSGVVCGDTYCDHTPVAAEVRARAEHLAAICRDHGVNLTSAAVQYPLRHPAVVSFVLGMRAIAHVHSRIERRASPIPDELWAELDESDLAPNLIGAAA